MNHAKALSSNGSPRMERGSNSGTSISRTPENRGGRTATPAAGAAPHHLEHAHVRSDQKLLKRRTIGCLAERCRNKCKIPRTRKGAKDRACKRQSPASASSPPVRLQGPAAWRGEDTTREGSPRGLRRAELRAWPTTAPRHLRCFQLAPQTRPSAENQFTRSLLRFRKRNLRKHQKGYIGKAPE